MMGMACSRCLNGGVLITFDGKVRYPCPNCCAPGVRATAIRLDLDNTLRAFDAIDAIVALELPADSKFPPCGPEHAYPKKKL